jgi:pyridoxal phosphate-dependent aminotransferase EpsN
MTSRARIPLSAQHIDEDEFEALRRGFAEGEFSPTEQVAAFEEEFAAAVGGVQAAAVTSGTAALHLALRSDRGVSNGLSGELKIWIF